MMKQGQRPCFRNVDFRPFMAPFTVKYYRKGFEIASNGLKCNLGHLQSSFETVLGQNGAETWSQTNVSEIPILGYFTVNQYRKKAQLASNAICANYRPVPYCCKEANPRTTGPDLRHFGPETKFLKQPKWRYLGLQLRSCRNLTVL